MLIEWAFKNICDWFLSAVHQGAAADTAIKRFLYEQGMSRPEVEHLWTIHVKEFQFL